MRKLNPDYLYAVRELINNCPYFRLLSMNVLELSPGHALLEAVVEEKHHYRYGGLLVGLLRSR
jgi:acyl-coenzyme A thioesterase PaaI-like protein